MRLLGVSQYSAFSTLTRSRASSGSSSPWGNQALRVGFHSSFAFALSTDQPGSGR